MLVNAPQPKWAEQDEPATTTDAGRQVAKALTGSVSKLPSFFAYESVAGGAGKRAIDIVVATLTAPLWMLAVLVGAAALSLRKAPRRAALSAHRRIGYGGKAFACWRLNVRQPSAEIFALPGLATGAAPAAGGRFTAIDLIERLPEMWNVLRGEMSLVGPRPVTSDEFTELGWSRKYYASARPGFVSSSDCGEALGSSRQSHKHYVRDWSFARDMRILQCAANRLVRGPKSGVRASGA